MFDSQKIITIPTWEEGIFEYSGRIVYGMVYDEVIHQHCFRIKAYTAFKKKGQNGEWKYEECASKDLVEDKAPHLAELLQFDGWLEEKGIPMYYYPNALYFYQRFRGWFTMAGEPIQSGKRPHWLLFCAITLFGTLFENEVLPTMDSEKELYVLSHWLKKREPQLRARFNEVMRKFEIT